MLALGITCPWWTLYSIWPVLIRIQIEVLLYLFGIILLVNLWANFLHHDELYFLYDGLAVDWAAAPVALVLGCGMAVSMPAADVDLATTVAWCKVVDLVFLLVSSFCSFEMRWYGCWCCALMMVYSLPMLLISLRLWSCWAAVLLSVMSIYLFWTCKIRMIYFYSYLHYYCYAAQF